MRETVIWMLPSLHSFLRECCFTYSMLTWSISYSPPFQFSTFNARNNVKFIWLMQCGPICVSRAMVWPSTWHMKLNMLKTFQAMKYYARTRSYFRLHILPSTIKVCFKHPTYLVWYPNTSKTHVARKMLLLRMPDPDFCDIFHWD